MAWSAAFVLFAAVPLPVQHEVPVFKVKTTLQSVAVRVTDRQGNDVRGLSAQDFTLLEDGHPQEIAYFGEGYQPLSLTMVIDSSSSMISGGKLDYARSLFGSLIRGEHPEDEIFFLPFTARIGRIQTLTKEQRLEPPEARVTSRLGGTALYDALASALCHMQGARHPRQAIVVITDGADQHSRLTLETLIDLARQSNPQIFMIGFFDKREYEVYRKGSSKARLISGREIDNPVFAFRRLSEESGAESFFPTSESDLKRVLGRLSSILQAQYTLAYYPKSLGNLRSIEVRVNLPGVTVEARRHAGSTMGEAVVRFNPSCAVSANEHPYPWESRVTEGPSQTIVYSEDFSDPTSGWPDLSSSAYSRQGYAMRATDHPVAKVRIAAYGPCWEGFRASVQVDAKGAAGRAVSALHDTAAAGMVFHLNARGYYALLVRGFGSEKDMAFRIVKEIFWESVQHEVVPWTKIGSPKLPGRDERRQHELTVESHRGVIRVAVNNQWSGEFRDETFSSGLVGLAISGNIHAVFSELVIEELP